MDASYMPSTSSTTSSTNYLNSLNNASSSFTNPINLSSNPTYNNFNNNTTIPNQQMQSSYESNSSPLFNNSTASYYNQSNYNSSNPFDLKTIHTSSLPSVSSLSSSSASSSTSSSSSPSSSSPLTNSTGLINQNDFYQTSLSQSASIPSMLSQQNSLTHSKTSLKDLSPNSTQNQSQYYPPLDQTGYYYNNYQSNNNNANQTYWSNTSNTTNDNGNGSLNFSAFDSNYNGSSYNNFDNQFSNTNYYYNNNLNNNNEFNWQNSNNNTVQNQAQYQQNLSQVSSRYECSSSVSNSPSCSESPQACFSSSNNYQSKIKLENLNLNFTQNQAHSLGNTSAALASIVPGDLNLQSDKTVIYNDSFSSNDAYFKSNKLKLKNPACLTNKISKSSIVKRKVKDEPKNLYLTSICNVCEKSFSALAYAQTLETCGDCKSFFKKFVRKSQRPPLCNLQHHNNQIFDINCQSCKYEKCAQVGLSLSKIKNGDGKQFLVKHENENEAKKNLPLENDLEIRNLSIEANSSNSSTSSISNVSEQTYFNLKQLISFILKEIENKKILIRSANSELKIKEYLTDLTKNLINYFLSSTSRHQKLSSTDTNNNTLTDQVRACKFQRPLLIAYSYLIDNDNENKSSILLLLTCDLSPFELKLVNQLHKIHSSNNKDQDLKAKSYNESNYHYYNQQPQQQNHQEQNYFSYYQPSYSYNTSQQSHFESNPSMQSTTSYENDNQMDYLKCSVSESNELKTLHFLLLLFSSFLNLDEFMQIGSSDSVDLNLSTSNDLDQIDASYYCQKLILQLIDNVCKDKLIKTKILLSVSDLELF